MLDIIITHPILAMLRRYRSSGRYWIPKSADVNSLNHSDLNPRLIELYHSFFVFNEHEVKTSLRRGVDRQTVLSDAS